jgi:hypothetical protein
MKLTYLRYCSLTDCGLRVRCSFFSLANPLFHLNLFTGVRKVVKHGSNTGEPMAPCLNLYIWSAQTKYIVENAVRLVQKHFTHRLTSESSIAQVCAQEGPTGTLLGVLLSKLEDETTFQSINANGSLSADR